MIYHLAAAVGVKLIVESPVRTIETNIKLTELVLEMAQKKKRPVFIASTSECYGKSTDFPFREEGDLVLGPSSKGRWSYACSKLIDEFWPSRTTASVACLPSLDDCLTPSDRARPASTAWSFRHL